MQISTCQRKTINRKKIILPKLNNKDSSLFHQWKKRGLTWYPFVLDVSLFSRSLYKIRQAKLCLVRKEVFPGYVPNTLIISILSIISFIKRNTLSFIFLLWYMLDCIALKAQLILGSKTTKSCSRSPKLDQLIWT